MKEVLYYTIFIFIDIAYFIFVIYNVNVSANGFLLQKISQKRLIVAIYMVKKSLSF